MGCCSSRDQLNILTYQYAKGKLGHRITHFHEDLLNNVLNAVTRAEVRKGAPVYFIEVYKIYKALYEDVIVADVDNSILWEVKGGLLELYRND